MGPKYLFCRPNFHTRAFFCMFSKFLARNSERILLESICAAGDERLFVSFQKPINQNECSLTPIKNNRQVLWEGAINVCVYRTIWFAQIIKSGAVDHFSEVVCYIITFLWAANLLCYETWVWNSEVFFLSIPAQVKRKWAINAYKTTWVTNKTTHGF